MEVILNFIFCNNLQVPLIAIITFILTGVLKLPIKRVAAKMKDGHKLTKFITFIPVIIGFAVTVLVVFISFGEIIFDEIFFTYWFSAVSLSLAIYAFWEKFIPSEKKILTQVEINDNKFLVEELKNVLTESVKDSLQISDLSAAGKDNMTNHKKIILKNIKKGE